MKKILSLLGTITLIGTSTTSLVACNTSQYSEEQLKKTKRKIQNRYKRWYFRMNSTTRKTI
ncbi:lipoprotein [Spiroplasma poulsonii]|uniref:lipoprotein n=1 Tax=Spiroplasma poulsonii TaxID=2138 RepID=UPI0013317541|nr:lipoprotein [Spiroplasma poulsonii]KAF0849994.1 putative lipoprotein [Spiroplasma poulsonii]